MTRYPFAANKRFPRRTGTAKTRPASLTGSMPLRSDLYSVQQMEQHGAQLAGIHKITAGKGSGTLYGRLLDNKRIINHACDIIFEIVQTKRQITPAAEWLLDNFYLISEQIRIAEKHLPKNYNRDLPSFLQKGQAVHPRIYELALEIITHSDARIDRDSMFSFLTAYQNITPLKLGELWTIPIMLRLALIENLRRISSQVIDDMTARNLANSWADQMIVTAEKDPANLILIVSDMARSKPVMDSAFVAELVRRLQGRGPSLALPMTWVEQRLTQSGTTVEELVNAEIQQQAVNQVSVGNNISSLRLLSKMDWRKFVEELSVVEQVLEQDPAKFYTDMDFDTRDHYRHAVEDTAKYSHLSEYEVAAQALDLAQRAAAQGSDLRQRHVGYYLLDKGLPQLEKLVQLKPPILKQLKRTAQKSPLGFYLGAIILLTLFGSVWAVAHADKDGTPSALTVLLGMLSLIAALQLAVTLVNWLITSVAKPDFVSRMDFSTGIPDQARTIVVVPSLLGNNAARITDLVDSLEIRFLANRDTNLYFALLTDFGDAATEQTEYDAASLQIAMDGINALNAKYCAGQEDIFFLFHRPRLWNAQENIWMAYERKRGKLGDLNALLYEGKTEAFSHIVGNIAALHDITYVITLDEDTQLPRDTAWQCIAAMNHPLNRPVLDHVRRCVTDGYGILQPRVVYNLPTTTASPYLLFNSGEAGIDPYTRGVSYLYQDAFREGSFIGKGIYEVAVFEQVLKDRFPENRILSHDLIEGNYIRSGVLSDVLLYEDYPASYRADVSRRHRWTRGDWQIFAWLFSTVPGGDGKPEKNPISALSRWKIFDNLRLSITPSILTMLLVLGWFQPSPWFWIEAVLGIAFLQPVLASIVDLFRKSKELPFLQHLFFVLQAMGRRFTHAGFNFLTLPYEGLYHLNAIVLVFIRLCITHTKLLEWRPSSDTNRKTGNHLVDFYRAMWLSILLPLVSVVASYLFYKAGFMPALLIGCAWAAAPALAWRMSKPQIDHQPQLSRAQIVYLGKLSRKTWRFFETLVSAGDNHLPPDNIQERPTHVVAHRTSPTNIGLSLLANLTAYDFGYIPLDQVIARTEKTLQTMAMLERYQGHFYNWYDTQSLAPLHPRYVSTVDSGNLAGHLLTLRSGLLSLTQMPIFNPHFFSGLQDTFLILKDTLSETLPAYLQQFETVLNQAQNTPPATLPYIKQLLEHLHDLAKRFAMTRTYDANEWEAEALSRQCADALQSLSEFDGDAVPMWSALARGNPENPGTKKAQDAIACLEHLAEQARVYAYDMEYDFLYDKESHLFAIGYNVDDRRRDQGFYDLLASEARLGIFTTIAQGKVPQQSWFALDRPLQTAAGKPILMSWSGSMFEYLMPLLVMPNFDNTLLDQTYKAVIKRQVEYGAQRNVPWGVSESGYYTFDAQLNYQYRAFGVPGLGNKRGLGDDLVIAPYATAMALMVAPEEACRNLLRLSRDGFEGSMGLYEAIDYTASRLPHGKDHALIQSYMSHHQGMSFLSLAYLLLDKPMQRYFEAEPIFQATMLLLHEKVPKTSVQPVNRRELVYERAVVEGNDARIRILTTANTTMPEVHLLSNGRYHVMITNAGGGYSRWKDLAVTRWREDSTRDNWGSFCYIRDLDSDNFWSTTFQPTLVQAKHAEVIFSEARAEFKRRDRDIYTHTEIVVSPEDDIELRRTKLINRSKQRRRIEITSYAEVVMAPQAADAAHPAFSNLFVQSEILHEQQAILCSRRPRSAGEHPPTMFHLMMVRGQESQAVSYETDRMKFIGRLNTASIPQAIFEKLSNSQGPVLDPIVAIRHAIILEPEESVTIDIVTGVAETRETCLGLIDKYQDNRLTDRVFDMAWTHSDIILRQLNATESEAQIYSRLANTVVYPNAMLRANPDILMRNRRGQSSLWSYAISGDLPIVLVKIKSTANIELVRQMLQAHAYWRLKGLAVDLIIWNEDQGSYRQDLQEQIMGLIAAGTEAHFIDRPGGVFVRPGDQISPEDRVLLESVARIILSDDKGTLAEQLDRTRAKITHPLKLVPTQGVTTSRDGTKLALPNDLILTNGLGGFAPDGREYLILTKPGQKTPAPWSNVLANPEFGSVISESGQAYSWSENAHAFRLTPWHNDPVTDAGGEAFYLRDEETGQFWSPTPMPVPSGQPYVTRHGFGYSVFEHIANGIHSELWVYVAMDAPVKYMVLKVRNDSARARKLSATGYVEWCLGDQRAKSMMHVVTEVEPATGAILARNSYNTDFAERTAFFDVDDKNRTVTGDRREFIGRNGSLQDPIALERVRLSGRVGAGFDPCAGLQVKFDLAAGQSREIVFTLGMAGRLREEVGSLIHYVRGAHNAQIALEAIMVYWRSTLGAVQIKTPDPTMNVMANGWLMYQTIASRIWARSGYYQSGGAFGFRDQLQDMMALIYCQPHLLRNHLLLAAQHQFVEGDAQHWWHPPSSRGVRTKCSDDYLWLPLAVWRYVTATGDTGVLNEMVDFIAGRPLGEHEESYYDLPQPAMAPASLYEHCVRAIHHALRFGEHGLPLIGSCDWNDGMDKVGEHGKGESVWLGFFLYDILLKFAEIACLRNDQDLANLCQDQSERLRANIEANGWDGNWYRRAYFDDGTPLGSAQNAECQIDSLSQSWAVLSGAGNPERARKAMAAVDRRLVRRDAGLILLLDPPFDKADPNPGYIRGYVPGVRENGGQYTHAAIWTAMAFAKMGDAERTYELAKMINPLNHTRNEADVALYKVEPYVVAADVYGVAPHTGRGGWTWYTGSSGWMYRLILESMLGLKRAVNTLTFAPCIPHDWPGFTMTYVFNSTIYKIVVEQTIAPQASMRVFVDDVAQEDGTIHLRDDEQDHIVRIVMETAAF